MLQPITALTSLGLTQSGNLSNLFKNKDTNRLSNTTKQTAGRKRRFTEVERGKTNLPTSKRPLQVRPKSNDQEALKMSLMNPSIIRIKQMEKSKMLEITTGMHPALKEAKDEITKLRINLRKVEEQSTFWRRRTLELQKELRSKKNNSSFLSEQVAKLEKERLVLQNKLTAAEEQSKAIMDAMKSLIAENNEMKETLAQMDTELNTLMNFDAEDAKLDPQVPEEAKACIDLEKALEDTMADLSERHSEIENLKTLLSEVTLEKNLLEKEVTKKKIIAEIGDVKADELEDLPVKGKVARLQEAVEKCMFRIAVLAQQNEELKKLNGKLTSSPDQDAGMVGLLEDNDKLAALESVCMQRFREVLKDAAEKLLTGDTMDESFCK